MKKLLKRFAKMIEGHFSIGNLTIFGDNAMHFGCHFWTKKYGYICWRLPLPCGISDKILYGDKLYWKPLYFYISRNATPWAAVFMLGKNILLEIGRWRVLEKRGLVGIIEETQTSVIMIY
jgi:hypothetical protein